MLCQFLLYNKVNQLYVYIYPHIPSLLSLPPTLLIPPLQVVTKHQADLPVLCSCFPLAIYFTFGSVYMSVLFSHLVPAYPSPSPYPQVHSLRLRHYSCPAPRFIRNIFFFFFFFRFDIYVLAYGICFSLSDLLHSVGHSLGPPTSLQMTQFRSFLWLNNIPSYICTTTSLSIRLLMGIQVASMTWLL